MTTIAKRLIGTGMIMSALALGCAPSRVAQHWGEAQSEASRAMVANPEAGRNTTAITGYDPVSAEFAQKNYEYSRARKSQARQPLPLVIPTR